MPRGSKDGSIKYVPADRDAGTVECWIVRKRYTDMKGRPREKKRTAYSLTEAQRLVHKIENEIEEELAGVRVAAQPARKRRFADLVTYYKHTELKPAEYVGETRIGGLRSFRKFESRIKPLEDFFGPMNLMAITYADCQEFKRRRLKTLTIHDKSRSIASVNRELSLLRHLFFIALRERWISEHPFHRGKPLIQIADEVSRMRILTWQEEEQILAQCVGPRAHLRLEILTAVETGLRQGEQFTLELPDVNLDDRVITLRAFNSKSAQTRIVPIFERLHRELAPRMAEVERSRTRSRRVFPVRDPKRAFVTACRNAGIIGLRWHDLRHTAITRMLHFYKIPAAEVMKMSGHSNYKTFLRYVNIDLEVARSIAARVDAIRAEADAIALPVQTEIQTVMNESEAVN